MIEVRSKNCLQSPIRRGYFSLLLFAFIHCATVNFAFAQTPDGNAAPKADPLSIEQQQVANRFQKLEELLLRSAELESVENPTRAALLQQAAQMGKKAQLSDLLVRAATSLDKKQYSQALDDQKTSRENLKRLLELLQSENRGERVREQRDQVRRWIEETDRLLRLQKSLSGRTEGGQEIQQAAGDQDKLSDKAQEIAKELGGKEEASQSPDNKSPDNKSPDNKSPDNKSPDAKSGDQKSAEQKSTDQKSGDQKSGDQKEPSEEKSEGSKSDSPPQEDPSQEADKNSKKDNAGKDNAEKKDSEKENSEKGDKDKSKPKDGEKGQPSDSDKSKPSKESKSESEQSESEQSESEQSESSQSESSKPQDGEPKSQPKQGESQPQQSDGKSGESGESEQQQPQDAEPKDPTERARKRIERAKQKMEEAEQELKKDKRKEAVEKQRQAEEELRSAIEALEEILRQLREEEIERSLASLETRLRRMLEMQTKVFEETQRLQEITGEQATRQVEIRASSLALEEKKILNEGQRAFLLLSEEGSSAAFPEAMQQVNTDISKIVERLTKADVGNLTVSIEQEIISSLEEMVAALVQVQKDKKEQKDKKNQPGQQQQGQPGEQPLVDKLAELRLIRTLQARINNRTTSLSQMLKDPADVVGQATEADLLGEVKGLAERQASIRKVARDIVIGADE